MLRVVAGCSIPPVDTSPATARRGSIPRRVSTSRRNDEPPGTSSRSTRSSRTSTSSRTSASVPLAAPWSISARASPDRQAPARPRAGALGWRAPARRAGSSARTRPAGAGADPAVILSDLATFSHVVTRLKLIPDAAKDPVLSEAERHRGLEFARSLSVRSLSRAWQILLKGIPEVQASNRPVAAAEMVLVRLAYAADLPTPDEALRALKEGGAPAGQASASAPSRPAAPSSPERWRLPRRSHNRSQNLPPLRMQLPSSGFAVSRMPAAMAGEQREVVLKRALERDVHLVRFEEGHIEFSLAEGASRTVANDLSRALQQWTGQRWMVAVSSDAGAQTLHHQAVSAERQRKEGAANHPLVQAVLAKFPAHRSSMWSIVLKKPPRIRPGSPDSSSPPTD